MKSESEGQVRDNSACVDPVPGAGERPASEPRTCGGEMERTQKRTSSAAGRAASQVRGVFTRHA